MNPQEAFEVKTTMLGRVKAHPMCARLEVLPSYYWVTYPPGAHYLCDGARVSRLGGDAKALARLLDVMERHWIEGLPQAQARE